MKPLRTMTKSNFQRMLDLADEVFNARHDPDQLDVNEQVVERLSKLHLNAVGELDDGNGPVAWIILIPTTSDLMHQFLNKSIGERELFERTPEDIDYDALYLCSAMVLQEYRRQGICRRLVMQAVENIRKDHPIRSLFVWTFSEAGNAAAEELSKVTGLPLFKR